MRAARPGGGAHAEAALKVVTASDDVAVATFANVVLVHFRGKTEPESVGFTRLALRELAAFDKVIFFAVIELASTPPDTEARRLFTKLFSDYKDQLACAVVAFETSGFRGAMVRAVVSTIFTVGLRFPFPRHVVSSIGEGATLAERALPGLDRLELLAAFEALRTKGSMPKP